MNVKMHSIIQHKLGVPDSSVNMKGYAYIENEIYNGKDIYVDITHNTYKGLENKIDGIKDSGIEEFTGFIRNGVNKFEPFYHIRMMGKDYDPNVFEELEDKYLFDEDYIIKKHLMECEGMENE